MDRDRHRDGVARALAARVADSGALDQNERIRDFYDQTARDYDVWLRFFDRWMRLSDGRPRLLSRAHGRTLEIGIGTGVNLH